MASSIANEAPRAMVKRRIGPVVKTRLGRGFSELELREAGLTTSDARRSGLAIDVRRSTKREDNIKLLKEWFEKSQSRKKG